MGRGYTYLDAAERLGVPFYSLENWVKTLCAQGKIPAASEPLPEADELKRLLQYAWIREHASMFPLALMRDLPGASRGYYRSLQATPSARKERREALKKEVIHFHARSMGIYGYRNVAEDIRREGMTACRAETVRRILRDNRLRAKVKQTVVVTTHTEQLKIPRPR